MCLAQFAISFKPGKEKKSLEFVDDTSIQKGTLKMIETEEQLPLQIYLNNNGHSLGVMSLRGYEAVLRIHNSKQKEGHEEFYSELVLFYPWRKENDELKRSRPDDCIKMYQENISVIYKNKSSIYPCSENIEKSIET